MGRVSEIEEAVRRLSHSERRQLFDWLAGMLDWELGVSKQDRPCRIHLGLRHLRFKIEDDDFVYRPDVWVACGNARDAKGQYVDEPRLVIGIHSPSTARLDKREKVFSHRKIHSIQEYVIVAQEPAHVMLYRRSRQWKPETLESLDAVLELQSVGLTQSLAKVYKGVSREAPR